MTYPLLTLRGFSILGERLVPELPAPRIARVTPCGAPYGPMLAASGEMVMLLERLCYAHAFKDLDSITRTVHHAETLLTRIRPDLNQCPILNPSEN